MINILKKYNQIVVGILFLFYFLYTLNNSLYISDNVMYSVAMTIIIYFQTVFLFLYFYNKYGKPRLQDWMRLAIFFMLVLNFMKIINDSNGSVYIEFIVTTLSLNDSLFAMITIIFALISLDISYIIFDTFRKNSYSVSSSLVIINRKYLVLNLLFISTIFQAYLLFSGLSGFGNTSNSTSGGLSFILMISTYINPFALIISAYIVFVEEELNKRYQIIFYSSLLIQILLGLLSGMKENTLAPILYTLIVFFVAGKKIPKKILITGIFMLILLYPINTSYRIIIGNPFLNTGSSISNMILAINKIISQPLSETLIGGVESYGDRSSMFPFLLYAIQNEYKWNYYKNMDRYPYLTISWVLPRALLEDKPKADIGGVLYEQITGIRTATAVTVTNIGWAYLEGGILFILITFILLGTIFEFIDRRNIKDPLALIFYAIILHKAIKPEWDSYFMISSLIPMLIIYWTLLKIIGTKRIQINEN